MGRQVLIIHGWSDTSRSFHSLATFLAGQGFAPKLLWLGDYISRDDDVRVEDVGKRMGEVIAGMSKTGELDKSFDVIVHSTGGLVAREWLTSSYKGSAEQCPMKRLVMLAPANYGSKLAANGKSFLGRIVKGYDNWFQSGQAMLNDLELSSPFQWALVQRDVLKMPGAADANQYYGKNLVWPFVIVGTHPYTSALRQIVNEDGGDGTVRVCAANLNARGVTFDFRESDMMKLVTVWDSRLEAEVPLAVLPTRTHGSIIDPDRADKDNQEKIQETAGEKQQLGQLILQALGCRDFDEYQAIHAAWDAICEQTAARHLNPQADDADFFHQYLQMNACVVDDQGHPVDDYFLEFFSSESKRNDDANVYLHRSVLEDVKKNSEFPYLRNLYFDRTDLVENYYKMLPGGTEPTLYMSISAAAPGKNINYFEREKSGAEQRVPIHLEGDQTKRWLKRNTTHFVQIVIPRLPNASVFKLTNFTQAK